MRGVTQGAVDGDDLLEAGGIGRLRREFVRDVHDGGGRVAHPLVQEDQIDGLEVGDEGATRHKEDSRSLARRARAAADGAAALAATGAGVSAANVAAAPVRAAVRAALAGSWRELLAADDDDAHAVDAVLLVAEITAEDAAREADASGPAQWRIDGLQVEDRWPHPDGVDLGSGEAREGKVPAPRPRRVRQTQANGGVWKPTAACGTRRAMRWGTVCALRLEATAPRTLGG